MPNVNDDHALNWDDEITKDAPDYVLLDEGDYDFQVASFEREWYDGGDNLPACPKAALVLKVETEQGTAMIRHNLFLCTSNEGRISSFFTALGLKQKDETVKMDWNKVIGSRGRAHIKIHEYQGKDGDTRKSNQVVYFHSKKDASKPTFTAGTF